MVTLALSGSLDKERLFSATSELVNLCAFSCKACDSFCIFNVHLFSFPTFASCTQRGTKAPPSLTQGVFLRACTFCILVGNISQVHFMCAYVHFALSSNTSQKPNFVFNSGKSSIFFLLKTSRNLPLYFAPRPLMRSTPWAESRLSPFCSPSLCFRHYKIQFNTLQCVPMFIAMFQTHYKIVCNLLQCVAM